MRVLLVSDVVREIIYSPQIRTLCEGVELVLSCGDLPYPYLEYIVTMLNVPLLYVPGNHDRPTYTADGRTVTCPEGSVDLDGRVQDFTVAGRHLIVAGLGGSMFYGGGHHQYTEREMRRRVRRMAPRLFWNRLTKGRAVDVLITHAPPEGIHDGDDVAHRGFHAFLVFMRRYKPKRLFHGHVHPSYGYDTKPRVYRGTEVRNIYGYELVEL